MSLQIGYLNLWDTFRIFQSSPLRRKQLKFGEGEGPNYAIKKYTFSYNQICP